MDVLQGCGAAAIVDRARDPAAGLHRDRDVHLAGAGDVEGIGVVPVRLSVVPLAGPRILALDKDQVTAVRQAAQVEAAVAQIVATAEPGVVRRAVHADVVHPQGRRAIRFVDDAADQTIVDRSDGPHHRLVAADHHPPGKDVRARASRTQVIVVRLPHLQLVAAIASYTLAIGPVKVQAIGLRDHTCVGKDKGRREPTVDIAMHRLQGDRIGACGRHGRAVDR